MTPGARLQAVIELLDDLDGGRPADRVLAGYFRGRRYAGAKDRRWVGENFYAILRRRARLAWWIDKSDFSDCATSRARVIAVLALTEAMTSDEIAGLFDGAGHAAAILTRDEQALAMALAGQPLDHPDMAAWTLGEFPEWLSAPLTALYGDRVAAEMAAFNRPAAVDLRVNTLKTDRDEAAAALAREGIEATPTPFSPVGLRLAKRLDLNRSAAYKEGLVEVQDEGSQIAALLSGAAPEMKIVDFCAGAGGKTLALAALLEGDGHIIACDTDPARLARLGPRLKRAGIGTVRRQTLTRDDDPWIAKSHASADIVFVDAPCTGAGAWRRNPDAKWRLTPEDVAACAARQDAILGAAAPLVRAGGRLVYVTCSILAAENEARIEAFLEDAPRFQLLPVQEAWREALDRPCPAGGDTLRLSPAAHGTDGFFVAILERRRD